MRKILEIIQEVEGFSFGETGTLRFYNKKYQDGYGQALKDISYLIRLYLKLKKRKIKIK